MALFKNILGLTEQPDTTREAAKLRMIRMLLDGIAVHAIRGNESEHLHFEKDLAITRDSLTAETNAEEFLIATGSALKTLQQYNSSTETHFQAQSKELRCISTMMADAIPKLASMSDKSATGLQEIERQIEASLEVGDLRKLKERLSVCLTTIREEAIRQNRTSKDVIGELNGRWQASGSVATGLNASRAESAADSLTGFGSRAEAEEAIAAAVDSRQDAFLLILNIDRLHSLNSRFGRKIGDQIIVIFAQQLTQVTEPNESIYRWTGPGFVAVLRRDAAYEAVRRQVTPKLNAKLTKNIDVNGRSLLIPLSSTWLLLPIGEKDKATGLIDKVESFLARQAEDER